MSQTKNKPIAVVISDVHYNINTIKIADQCMRSAIAVANELEVPLVVAGDLHDTKANLRGECVRAMLDTFELTKSRSILLVGNHDRLNEKSEADALDFLRNETTLIRTPTFNEQLGCYLIPYQHDVQQLKQDLSLIPTGAKIIMHQGLQGALAGGYAHDKTALTQEEYAPFKIISGHYHEHQTKGAVTYVGNPYTLDFSEAKHPPKGFIVLNEDFTFDRVLTNVRRHYVVEIDWDTKEIKKTAGTMGKDDIILVKIQGTKNDLAGIEKNCLIKLFDLPEVFRLDLIPKDSQTTNVVFDASQTAQDLYNSVVDAMPNFTEAEKKCIKQYWESAT